MKNMDVEHKLQKLIDEVVKSDKHVKNAVLAVSTGGGEFNWSSAAGMADPEENQIMTVDTPVLVVSVYMIDIPTLNINNSFHDQI
jgi:hypothetical protein